ncbi:MAG: glycosyltransferase family 2 protein [Chitinophagaceae bacterium]|jgi:hypothetical protein|nr:glycosyltransferase family 2 protein [Chitinophagaceae bacterium]
MNAFPSVAICLLNYNGRQHLATYLPSVLQHGYPEAAVYLIDNASTDDSIAFLQTHYPTVQLVQNTMNGGFAEGYNRGLQGIAADYLLLLNTDVAITPGFLQPLVAAMQADEQMAAVQPTMASDRFRDHFEYAGAAGGFIDWLGYPFCRGRLFDTVEENRGQYNDTIQCAWASGACLLIRRQVFWQLGGFYPWFFMHMEEIDLCWRAINRGYKIASVGSSTVYHLGGGSLAKESPRKTWFNFRNNLVMICRNMPRHQLLPVLVLRWGLDWLACLQMLLKGQADNAWQVPKAWIAFLGWLLWPAKGKWPGRRGFAGPGFYRGSILWQYFVKKKTTTDFL